MRHYGQEGLSVAAVLLKQLFERKRKTSFLTMGVGVDFRRYPEDIWIESLISVSLCQKVARGAKN